MNVTGSAVAVLVLAAAACHSVTSIGVEPIRIVPPSDGECVGTVEVTIVNDGTAPMGIGRLSVLLPDERSDVTPPMGPPGPAIASIEPPWTGQVPLEPGASRVLTKTVVRTLAEPLTKDAIDRAVAEGRGVRVVFYEMAAPVGGVRMLDVRTDGVVIGTATGAFGTPDGEPIVGTGKMDATGLAAFVAVIRAAPLDAFPSDPKWRSSKDGHRVRLLVAAGRSACVLSSMGEDFRAAGLEPLLQQLRSLIVALPRRP